MLENQIKKLSWFNFITMIFAGLIFVFGYFLQVIKETPGYVGSVETNSEYHATTTYSGQPTLQYLDSGVGTLGSLVITKAGAAATLNYLYDATTTNANLRTSNMSTTSIILAAWPGNLAAGTYTFDQIFYNGLLLELAPGSGIGSTTITFKP